ncbi:chemoreceptor glutamine deamidase CheD [Clostridium tepidiprofundi DSM 19306]|uniref:Probable chemoreceptor glutamine deamidase CheD n=1 Tax=Clostridium tepidiprofundi DSM 19306 TaxID=1121338 RepID=A0A151B4F3_9CLOT|nr:chemotaxis protein CheD [Clostridium tepidiprofundi]KYH34785.1 chemoreceptor glutamine deamidase CheD [Clostridium tepidiprofundi DSM 19306]
MAAKEIRIGIADLNVGNSPDVLITVGLGSCVGIALFDKRKKIGGLAHIMLPDSKQFSKITNEYKFADLAIPVLLDKMIKSGASKYSIEAKIAGGASMFNFSDKSMIMDIGSRNSTAVKKVLKELSIPLIGEDVGGNKGRTMIFDTDKGTVSIKTVGQGIKVI